MSTDSRKTDTMRGPVRGHPRSDRAEPNNKDNVLDETEQGHNDVKRGEWQRIARSRGEVTNRTSDGVLDDAKKRAQQKYSNVKEALLEEKRRLGSPSMK